MILFVAGPQTFRRAPAATATAVQKITSAALMTKVQRAAQRKIHSASQKTPVFHIRHVAAPGGLLAATSALSGAVTQPNHGSEARPSLSR